MPRRRPRPLDEDLARALYAGFEHFVEDTDAVLSVEDFAAWCFDEGISEFLGFPAVWRAYELCVVETGTLPLNKPEFQRAFGAVARRPGRGASKKGKRPTRYVLKPLLRLAA